MVSMRATSAEVTALSVQALKFIRSRPRTTSAELIEHLGVPGYQVSKLTGWLIGDDTIVRLGRGVFGPKEQASWMSPKPALEASVATVAEGVGGRPPCARSGTV